MFLSSPEEVCDCDRLTMGFIAQVQRRADFGSILEETRKACSGLTVALTEVSTLSVPDPEFDGGPGGPGAGITN
jgi:hypothetical protein